MALIFSFQDSSPAAPCALWPADLKLTHLDWNPEATLIHFQGQYLTICELDYKILQGEIQNIIKTKAAVDVGEFCLVEDLTSARWYRGRVQNQKEDVFDVFLIDYGNVLSVDIAHISSCSNDLLILPPKIVCGFLANVLLHQDSHSDVEQYLESLIGKNVTGYIQALLPHKVLLLEAPDINNDLVRHGFGRHVDTVTFLFLVEMLTEVPLKLNFDPVPDLLIEKPRGQEFCFKQSGLQGYKDMLSFFGPRLNCGIPTKVRVTAAVNPGLFYCQLASMETELWEMSKKLAAVCEKRTKTCNQKTSENLGLLCSVKGKDGKWYRGFVQFLPMNSQVRVMFIDYGFFESVKVEDVHRLPFNLYSAPIMAFPCMLSSLSDPDEAVKNQQLSLLKAGLLGGVLEMEIASFDDERHLYSVTLIGTEDDHVKEPEPIKKIQRTEVKTEQPCSPGGYLRHETIVDKASGKAQEAEDCPMYNVKHYTDGTTEKADDNVFEALSIKPGCEFAVHCSCINSPSDFWCQRQDRVQALEELMDKIQQFYSTNTVPLQPGTSCCVAKSPEDGKWYRASIIAKQKSDARVILVDYGFIFNVKDHNLQSITPEYVNLEKQAFRCSFSNLIEPADSENYEDWSPEACSSLKSFILQSIHSLRCKVISKLNVKNKGLCNTVDLFNTQTQQSMPNLLLEQGLAREAKVLTKQLSTISPVSFVYSSYDLSPGSEKQVFVTHVCSQWEIYCHLEENTQIIEELERKIIKERVKMMQANKSDVVRKLCLAKYLDGRWYRGLALPVQSPLHLSVFFVDYGNTNISEKSHIMFIPRDSDDLLYTPMQAVRCCLASVSKEELYADAKDWLNKATLNKQVKAVILGKNEDGSFDVELFDGDVNINEKVKELIKKPQALHTTTNISVKSSQRKVPSSNSCRDTYAGKAPEKEKQKTKLSVRCKTQSKNMKVTQKEEKMRSCVPLRSSKNSEVKRQEHQDTNTKSEQPSQSNKEEIPQLWCSADKVNECLKAKCFISHVESACNFFLHLSEDEPAILKMAESLNSGIIKNSLKAATSVTVSDLVLAEYEEDGALYRCVVKDYEGNSCFKVEYIDYGNSAVVGKENIFFIPKEYYSQSRFSIPCSLLDTSTYENDASFTDAVMEKPLMVDFVQQRGSQWEVKVEIFDLESTVNESIPVNEDKTEEFHTCENETSQPVEDENVPSKTPAVTMSTKLKTKTCSSSKDRQRGTLLSVQSNGDFYVRLARTSSLLAALESGIAENLHKCKMVVKEDVKQGVKCLVQVHMDRWQRAVVQDVAGEKCKVLLVDHGVTEEVPTDLVRLQCADLTKIQNLAVLCRMNCVGFREGEDAHRLLSAKKPGSASTGLGQCEKSVFSNCCLCLWQIIIKFTIQL
uniref:Si:dkeyp-93d12.1 n=1 Tax=Echeneis naucrates TaxID=173247 RepID=A0A665V4U3_ECHNA